MESLPTINIVFFNLKYNFLYGEKSNRLWLTGPRPSASMTGVAHFQYNDRVEPALPGTSSHRAGATNILRFRKCPFYIPIMRTLTRLQDRWIVIDLYSYTYGIILNPCGCIPVTRVIARMDIVAFVIYKARSRHIISVRTGVTEIVPRCAWFGYKKII